MYDDSWFLSDTQSRRADDVATVSVKQKRRESLLKQPTDGQLVLDQAGSLPALLEEPSLLNGPPKATLISRASSYGDFSHISRAELTKEAKHSKLQSDQELSILNDHCDTSPKDDWYEAGYEDDLLDASQEEFILYRDQLRLTERHLDTLIADTNSALSLLAGLSDSFDTVEKETTAFKSQCQVLLDDQQQLRKLKEEVGDGLQYYGYLEPITRRLNAPGASRLVRDAGFIEMLINLNNCIWFMSKHKNHREAETYQARYSSLLLRALNLLESQFQKDLNDRLEDIRKRRVEGSLNDTTIHALLYRPLSSEMEQNLRFLGSWAVELNPSDYPDENFVDPEMVEPGSGSFAKACLHNMIRGIVDWRRDLLAPIVQEYIQSLNVAAEQNKREDLMKECRACIKTVLDLCKEELQFIHRYFFDRFWEAHQYAQPIERYTAYLSDICKQVAEVVFQIVGRVDLSEAVDLTTWIERCYVLDYSQYKDAKETIDAQLFEVTRKIITIKMANDIKEIILARFGEITLRKIEKYEPTQEDLEIAPPYIDRRGSLSGTKVTVAPTRKISDVELDALDQRAVELVGEGYLTAYPPLKSAIRMLILHNEMFPSTMEAEDTDIPMVSSLLDAVEKSRFEIIHQTVAAIAATSSRILHANNNTKTATTHKAAILNKLSQPKPGYHHHLFVIHNLYLLKQLILVYELHGVRKTSQLDFTDVWTTLRGLRDRGRLLDPRAYYSLLREGKLLPRVLEQTNDARLELDGVLRSNIVQFTEGWATHILRDWKKEGRRDGGGEDDASFAEVRWILGWTLVGEEKLIGALLLAIRELCLRPADSWGRR